MAMFAGQEWFEAFGREIEASEAYREAAADWEGDIAFLVEAEPDRGLRADVWGLLDLWHGACRGGGVIHADRGREAAYILRAPYSRWKEVVTGELDPIKAQWDAAGCTGGIACPAIACVNPGTHAVCVPANSGDLCMGAN